MSTSLDIKDLPGEIWENIPGYFDDYQVSNMGRVKSFIKRRPQILKKTLSMGKYKVQLYSGPGRFKNELVGRLVCEVFNGPPEENSVVIYIDGNKLNDRADNVRWSTKKESVRTAVNAHRYSSPGALNGMAKLTPDKVKAIKSSRGKESLLSMSQKFGISKIQISRIINGRSWKNV